MYEQRLPIEEWKFQKQKERNDTIAAQKKVLQEVVQDGQRLADYLYGRGRLGSHITSGNAALVLQTLPQARAVLTARDWDKFGRRVNKGAKGIPQLVRVNGYYNVGSIFDVSMTYGNKPHPIPEIIAKKYGSVLDISYDENRFTVMTALKLLPEKKNQ